MKSSKEIDNKTRKDQLKRFEKNFLNDGYIKAKAPCIKHVLAPVMKENDTVSAESFSLRVEYK